MPKLTVISDHTVREIPFSVGSSVREILDAAGVEVRSGCRGNGACGLCLVRIEAGSANGLTENERLLLPPGQFGKNTRLACQLRPKTDLHVRIVDAVSKEGRSMNVMSRDQPQLFDAFIKSVQYLVRLKTQQDVWDHLGKFIMTYFPADWTAIAQRDAAQAVTIHRCTGPGEASCPSLLTDDVRAVIGDVMDSGFLASCVVRTPEPSMTAFLPIVEEYSAKKVMLVGHRGTQAIPNELLNIYLALAGLAGTTFERLQSEHELNRHRAHLEELVRERTAELETANRELEAFSYSVSHDLRSPLRSIDGFSLALIEDYRDKLDDEGRDYLARIRGAALRMSLLIDDMLKLSRVTRMEMKREQVDLSALAASIAARLREHQPERPAEFHIAGGLTAFGDERLLTVALENLFSNAWKFSEKSSRTVIKFGVTGEKDVPAFFVRDNGVGFDMIYADKLFSPFQRLHHASEFPGTGIGLATVKRVINRHGGRVWIEAEPGKGTTVYFTLG